MWHEHLRDNYFISQLYDKVPELINTEVMNIQINREGEKITVSFKMPKYADNPPKKWSLSNNTIIVELDFSEIEALSLTYNSKEFLSGDIKVESNNNGLRSEEHTSELQSRGHLV